MQELERLKRSSLYFSVADLSHLARNGRLPRFGEVVGNLLGLRPILRIEKGHIRFLRVAREGSVPETLARLVAEELGGKAVRVAIAHSTCIGSNGSISSSTTITCFRPMPIDSSAKITLRPSFSARFLIDTTA